MVQFLSFVELFLYLCPPLLFLYIGRCYCTDCLNILVGQGTFDALKLLDPWICYLCQPHRLHGALIPREDWSVRVQDLFANNSAMEFVSDQQIIFNYFLTITANSNKCLCIFKIKIQRFRLVKQNMCLRKLLSANFDQ